jgi:hypothetical protein
MLPASRIRLLRPRGIFVLKLGDKMPEIQVALKGLPIVLPNHSAEVFEKDESVVLESCALFKFPDALL